MPDEYWKRRDPRLSPGHDESPRLDVVVVCRCGKRPGREALVSWTPDFGQGLSWYQPEERAISMPNTRKRYSVDFKAKVALQALKGELTLAQLASKHGVHQTMMSTWRKQAVDRMASVFSGKADAAEVSREADAEKLPAKIGQIVVEQDFLQKPSVDEPRPEARDDRAGSSKALDCDSVQACGDQPVWPLPQACAQD